MSNSRVSGIGMTSARTRERLVARLRESGIADPQVLDRIRSVPRHLFVDEALASRAYEDTALPLGHGQTISQPLMVATMLEAMELEGHERVLEVGAGCGYQAALLAELAREVYTVEIVEELARMAAENLKRLGYRNVTLVESDGSVGYVDGAPYDGIVVAAAAPAIPGPLIEQLAPGGRLLIPVGGPFGQMLERVRRGPDDRIDVDRLGGCAFVPLVGAHGR